MDANFLTHNHCASSRSESSQEIVPEVVGEELEPWHTWLQRVTHEIEHQMDKVGVVSWVEAQRKDISDGPAMWLDTPTAVGPRLSRGGPLKEEGPKEAQEKEGDTLDHSGGGQTLW